MSWLEKNLIDGENVKAINRIHWSVYLAPTIIFLFGLIGIMINHKTKPGVAVFASLIMIFGFVFFITAILNRKTTQFIVTDKRVLIRYGIIKKTTWEILLTKLEAINISQGFLGRIFNYGNLIFIGSGGSKNDFKRIEDPENFQKMVKEQL